MYTQTHGHTLNGKGGATEEMKDKEKHRSEWKENSLKSLHTHTMHTNIHPPTYTHTHAHIQLVSLHHSGTAFSFFFLPHQLDPVYGI